MAAGVITLTGSSEHHSNVNPVTPSMETVAIRNLLRETFRSLEIAN